MKAPNTYDWILNTKYKITFDVFGVQNLNDIKGQISFTEHFFQIKIINKEKTKTNIFEVIKNMLNPIYCDEENQIYINYCLIKSFSTQYGLIDLTISNPVNKRIFTFKISSMQKTNILFSSLLKVEEINKISKSMNSKATAEIKHTIEQYLLMIKSFKEVLEKSFIIRGLPDEKIIKALNETKTFYEKNVKELKKQNKLKNNVNDKILKEEIQAKQANNNSISLLSRIEAENYVGFQMILSELKNKGLRLIRENVYLFFEITSLENNILNLKQVDKSIVSVNLRKINSKTNTPTTNNNHIIDEDGFLSKKNSNKYLHSGNYKTNANINNNKNKANKNSFLTNYNGDKLILDTSKLIYLKNSALAEKYKTLNTIESKSFDYLALVAKSRDREDINTTEFDGRNKNMKTEISELRKTPNPNAVKKNRNDIIISSNTNNLKTLTHTDNNEKYTTLSTTNQIPNHNNNNNDNESENIISKKVFRRKDSYTITDVNGLFEDIINQKNNNNPHINKHPNSQDESNSSVSTPNLELILPKNKLEPGDDPNFENYFFETNEIENTNEYESSSTKTNSKKEETNNSKTNNGMKLFNNLKELQETKNMQNTIETPKFRAKNNPNSNLKKTGSLKELENITFTQLTKKISMIKENHLFLVSNSWNNIFSNSSEFFCRKYFELCVEEYFPKFFAIEKDSNGIIKTDSFYSYFFYLRGLKNYLFTDENKIQFSNVFFLD